MSKDTVNELNKMIQSEHELQLKAKAVKEIEIKNRYDSVVRARKETEALRRINFDADMSEHIIKQNTEYLQASKKRMQFLIPELNSVVPYFGKNLILIGANSGEGKSTITANIILGNILQKRKTLVITNEEFASDVYNRVACLIKGWTYSNHDQYTDEQRDFFNEFIKSSQHLITVIEDSRVDEVTGEVVRGQTTTVEGIKAILDGLVENKKQYDAIVLDYIQKVNSFKEDSRGRPYDAIMKTMYNLDNFKNEYMAPVVVLAQLIKEADRNEKSFEERIRHCHAIIVPATCAIEAVADKKNLKTLWIVHKSRWHHESMDLSGIPSGWYKGMYVSTKNPTWQKWSTEIKAERINKTLEESVYGKQSNQPGTDLSGTSGDEGAE